MFVEADGSTEQFSRLITGCHLLRFVTNNKADFLKLFVYMKITGTCFSLHSDRMLSVVFFISLYICSFPAIVFPCGCFNRRNVCCLHSEPEFVFLFFSFRFSCVKTAMLFKELVCLFSILPSALSSSLQFSRQKKQKKIIVILRLQLAQSVKPQMLPLSVDLHFK